MLLSVQNGSVHYCSGEGRGASVAVEIVETRERAAFQDLGESEERARILFARASHLAPARMSALWTVFRQWITTLPLPSA